MPANADSPFCNNCKVSLRKYNSIIRILKANSDHRNVASLANLVLGRKEAGLVGADLVVLFLLDPVVLFPGSNHRDLSVSYHPQ